ncbi:MAG TPA: hypothetical protein VN776_12930 [Terracidiphilus sp.]|nr:hypothetical protein [Terracidiphilus sp.]
MPALLCVSMVLASAPQTDAGSGFDALLKQGFEFRQQPRLAEANPVPRQARLQSGTSQAQNPPGGFDANP